MAFRRAHPVLRRRKWFEGRSIHGSGEHDIIWFNPDGGEMTEEQWQDGLARVIGVFFNGEEIATLGPRGERIIDDSFILLFNAHHEPLEFALPESVRDGPWRLIIDTTQPGFVDRNPYPAPVPASAKTAEPKSRKKTVAPRPPPRRRR